LAIDYNLWLCPLFSLSDAQGERFKASFQIPIAIEHMSTICDPLTSHLSQ
jgi:hypothetical protein